MVNHERPIAEAFRTAQRSEAGCMFRKTRGAANRSGSRGIVQKPGLPQQFVEKASLVGRRDGGKRILGRLRVYEEAQFRSTPSLAHARPVEDSN